MTPNLGLPLGIHVEYGPQNANGLVFQKEPLDKRARPFQPDVAQRKVVQSKCPRVLEMGEQPIQTVTYLTGSCHAFANAVDHIAWNSSGRL